MRLLVVLAGLAGAGLQRCWGLRLEEEPLPQCRLCTPEHNLRRARIPSEANWTKAVAEEGLDPGNVSLFGTLAPKIPRSHIERFAGINHTKVFRYSFMGSAFVSEGKAREIHPTGAVYHARRRWMFDFARQNFTSQDFLNIVDAPPDWVPLGDFDHSNNTHEDNAVPEDLSSFLQVRSEALASRAAAGTQWFQKQLFWRVTAKSQFTLCPGGDGPWSIRAFEAVLAGSIPVINDWKEDWQPGESEQLNKGVLQAIINRFHYVKLSDLPHTVYNQTIVDENWRTLIKYMTFMEGDNEIPGLTRCECFGEVALK